MPKKKTIGTLNKFSQKCQGCDLYKNATQTVFGEGPDNSDLIVVGEQPGAKEDILGKPFTGPSGIFLRKIMEECGLDLQTVYFTNVVKHFKFENINGRKMHRTPIAREIKACTPWLEAEIELINPKIILCLGVTAAKTLVSKSFHLHEERGKWIKLSPHTKIIVSFHPSAILRAPDEKSRHELKNILTKDIKKIANFLKNR